MGSVFLDFINNVFSLLLDSLVMASIGCIIIVFLNMLMPKKKIKTQYYYLKEHLKFVLLHIIVSSYGLKKFFTFIVVYFISDIVVELWYKFVVKENVIN